MIQPDLKVFLPESYYTDLAAFGQAVAYITPENVFKHIDYEKLYIEPIYDWIKEQLCGPMGRVIHV